MLVHVPVADSRACRLTAAITSGDVDVSYRLARIVARVLVSSHLRQRAKWCELARTLAADPVVEDRLVLQAVRWLRRIDGGDLKLAS
jgi:hypothetical protein